MRVGAMVTTAADLTPATRSDADSIAIPAHVALRLLLDPCSALGASLAQQ
jgi:hypothetical protein